MNNTYNWYQALKKPSFAPPSYLFGPVWTFLYVIIFLTFGYVFVMFLKKQIGFIILLPFILNLIFNLAFTPLQFGLKNNFLAMIDIILVLATLIWLMIAIYPHSKTVAYLQIPYLLWVSFATILQISITFLDR